MFAIFLQNTPHLADSLSQVQHKVIPYIVAFSFMYEIRNLTCDIEI